MNPVATPSLSTRERILDAAEHLFAQHGFAGTSMRQLTAAAGVNLAAVNYHFGSKDKLIAEVFQRRLDTMYQARLAALKRALATTPPQLEDVLRAFVEPALDLIHDGGSAFLRVMAHAYAETNEPLWRFLSERYGHVLREFGLALAQCLPDADRDTLHLRLDFLAGALTYAMSDLGLPRGADRAATREDQMRYQRIADELIVFSAAGFRAAFLPKPR
jgi:AcrR family transcriptional regulator